MDTKKNPAVAEKIKFIEDYCIPAIVEHRETGATKVRHPVSGERLKIDRNDSAGYIVVYTDADGVLYRVNFKANPVQNS